MVAVVVVVVVCGCGCGLWLLWLLLWFVVVVVVCGCGCGLWLLWLWLWFVVVVVVVVFVEFVQSAFLFATSPRWQHFTISRIPLPERYRVLQKTQPHRHQEVLLQHPLHPQLNVEVSYKGRPRLLKWLFFLKAVVYTRCAQH